MAAAVITQRPRKRTSRLAEEPRPRLELPLERVMDEQSMGDAGCRQEERLQQDTERGVVLIDFFI